MRRKSTILASMDVGASGTKVIDITLKEQISRISMIFEVTNVTVSVMLAPVTSCISKIELVDGSKVLVSTNAARLQAINYFDNKKLPYDNLSLTVGGKFVFQVNMDFGRYLYDAALALRPEMFANLQLKITFDEDACNTSAVVNALSVYADVDDNPAGGAAKGYMVVQDIYSYAMAASGHEYPRIPADEAIKRIVVQPLSTDHAPVAMLSNVKVSIDNDKYVPYDLPVENHYRMLTKYPKVTREYTLDNAVTAKDIYAAVTEDVGIKIAYDGTAFVTAQSLFAVPTITGAKIALAASVDIAALTAVITGALPHNCIPFDFGDEYLTETWLLVGAQSDIRMDIEASSDADSGDTNSVTIQSLRMY